MVLYHLSCDNIFLNNYIKRKSALGYNFLIVKRYVPLFKEAFFNTLSISAISLVIALVIGILGGIARVSKNKFISKVAAFYVNVVRSTPLLAQLYLIYFGLPFLGINFNVFFTGIITLSLHSEHRTQKLYVVVFKLSLRANRSCLS